ncbi:zinc metalloprotease [Sporocytophaga myxococcoides]|uniref:Zinc metalloprotease n=1 Tax=Sporocytophaga myxococcoides TaxID=153721 RepID=A0A098LHR3_9BACT|nr:M48 family metallopeptidase [Sporocytophaga myxococcoides]GAL86490.1 zinc metalloprotease [Sporocytophaga myxococcoides]
MLLSIKRLKILSLAFLSYGAALNSGYSQTEKDFTPLAYSSEYPESFSENYREKIQTLVSNEKTLSKKRAYKFYLNLYQSKAQYFSSGQIYFENKLHKYVNSVAEKLFAKNPSILSKIKIYVSRNTSANAYAMPDGTILIHVGLLARVENEAQLAAIIAHETAHVELQHAIKNLSKMESIKSQETNFENDERDNFRSLKYSREDEFEADSKAIQYMMNSEYDPSELPKILEIIENENYFKIDKLQENLNKYLFSDLLTADTLWFKEDNSESSEKSKSLFGAENDDLYSTHPDMNKRVSAAKEILNLIEFKGTDKVINLMGNQSKEIKNIALFECIEGMEKDAEYNTGLYLTLYALEKNPDNLYLKTSIVKNLYWLSFYKEINCLDKVISNSGRACKENFDLFNIFLTKIPHNELKKLMFNYTKKNLESCQTKDDFFFYYGLGSEMYLGKDPSKLIFNQYLLKFPSGKFITTAKAKIQ